MTETGKQMKRRIPTLTCIMELWTPVNYMAGTARAQDAPRAITSRIFIKSSDSPSKLRSSEPINWSRHRSCENTAKRTHVAREIFCKVGLTEAHRRRIAHPLGHCAKFTVTSGRTPAAERSFSAHLSSSRLSRPMNRTQTKSPPSERESWTCSE